MNVSELNRLHYYDTLKQYDRDDLAGEPQKIETPAPLCLEERLARGEKVTINPGQQLNLDKKKYSQICRNLGVPEHNFEFTQTTKDKGSLPATVTPPMVIESHSNKKTNNTILRLKAPPSSSSIEVSSVLTAAQTTSMVLSQTLDDLKQQLKK